MNFRAYNEKRKKFALLLDGGKKRIYKRYTKYIRSSV